MGKFVLDDVIPVVCATLFGASAWRGERDAVACCGGDGPDFGHSGDADAEVFFVGEDVDLCFACGFMLVVFGDGGVDFFDLLLDVEGEDLVEAWLVADGEVFGL